MVKHNKRFTALFVFDDLKQSALKRLPLDGFTKIPRITNTNYDSHEASVVVNAKDLRGDITYSRALYASAGHAICRRHARGC